MACASRTLARAISCASVALALVLLGPAAAEAKSGRLTLHPGRGEALPVENGATLVHVQCRGDDRCRGRVQLLPRGRRARSAVGTHAIASRTVSVDANVSEGIRVRISRSARSALSKRPLSVTIDLTSQGKQSEVTESSALYIPTRDTGHSKPDKTRTQSIPNGSSGSDSVSTYSWHWTLRAGSVLFLPQFICPSENGNVATNGQEVQTHKTHDRVGLRGNLNAQASSGVGYAAFNRPTVQFHQGSRGNFPDYDVMTGWRKGEVLFNSIWAPLFVSGTFDLSVTCTSSEDRNSIAYVDHGVVLQLLFPWGTQ